MFHSNLHRLTNAKPLRSFSPLELKSLYRWPLVAAKQERVHCVIISMGGGLLGAIDSDNTLQNSECSTYWSSLGIPIEQQPTVKVVLLKGALNDPLNDATSENTIDVQTFGALVPSSLITLLIVPNDQNAFVNAFSAALDMNPLVVSCSWGANELSIGVEMCRKVDLIFQKFVAKGINICCAAGDNGQKDSSTGRANVDFPSSSPFVLACGGTRLVSPTDVYTPEQTVEKVWNDNPFSSSTGGGRSVIFPKPTYQRHIAGNARCTPDASSVADPETGIRFLINGTMQTIGGTSVSAPYHAGLLAYLHVNCFVNPLLYAAPASCFHDIVQGNNDHLVLAGEQKVEPNYSAGKGFDMCSGLGSLIVDKFQAFIHPKLNSSVGNNVNPQEIIVPINHLTFEPCLALGQTMSLPVTIFPADTSDTNLLWTSSNVQHASVDAQTGLITALSPGESLIKATSQANPKKHCEIKIRVLA
jgi:kumamolisin